MQKSASADEFISKNSQWQEILTVLHRILLSTGLEETIKWGVPVYTLGGKNIVGLTAFKNFSALWFFQGALLRDKSAVLVNAQEGKTRAQRQWRFESIDDVDENRVKAYILEAIKNQEQGRLIKPEPKKAFSLPGELSEAFDTNPQLQTAFESLAPYKRREYAEYISEAKRVDTKSRRLEKSIPLILAGKGIHDHYR